MNKSEIAETNWIAMAEDFLFTKYANIRGKSTLLIPILAAFGEEVERAIAESQAPQPKK